MSYRSWTNKQLEGLYEDHLRHSAFHAVPKWRRWLVTVFCITTITAGISALTFALAIGPRFLSVLVALGIVGGITTFVIVRRENRHLLMRGQVEQELIHRGLYEKSSVRIVAPWEN